MAPPTGSAPPKGSGVWSKPPIARGIAIEDNLAQTEYAGWYRVGATQRGKFPLVDFQKGDTLVSVRTVDTASQGWYTRIARHIDDLSSRGATVAERTAKMILDLRVQPGGAVAAQPLVQYGRLPGKNVQVIVREYP